MFTGIQPGVRRVAWAQAVLAPGVTALAGWVSGAVAAQAALFGVLTALCVSLVLVWHERRALRHPEWDQHRLLKLFLRASLERLMVLLVLLALGLGVLRLAPLPLLLGLMLAQLGWLAVLGKRTL